MNPSLFEREGHRVLDGKGGVIFVDPSKVGLLEADRIANYSSYSKNISIIVKTYLKTYLSLHKWYYIYAFDGKIFIPIINSNARSSAFVGKNSPYEDILLSVVCAPPLSPYWHIIIPENFGRVEFSCGDSVTDISYQFPDASYSATSRESHFPSLLYNYKRGAKVYDAGFHIAAAFKILLVACSHRTISRAEWNSNSVLESVDKLYCLGELFIV